MTTAPYHNWYWWFMCQACGNCFAEPVDLESFDPNTGELVREYFCPHCGAINN